MAKAEMMEIASLPMVIASAMIRLLVSISEIRDPDEMPPLDVLLETMADMMDRLLTPEDGGNTEAAKAIIRELFAAAGARFNPPTSGQ